MNKKLIFTLILTLFLIGIFISASSADLNDNNLGITDDDAENVESSADDNAVDATDDNADSQSNDDSQYGQDEDMLKTSDDDNILNADEKKNITVTIKTQEGTTFPNVQLSLVLYRNGHSVGECTLPNSNNDDPHKHTFTNLDVNDANGNPYRYTFDEVKVNGYDVRQGFVDDNGTSYDIVLSEVTGGNEQPQDEPPAETPDNNDTDPDNNKTNPDNNNTDTNEDKETNQDNNKTTDTQDNKNPTTTTKTTKTTTTVTKTTPDKEKQNNTTANAQKDNNTKIKDNKNTGYPIAILVAVLAVIGITFALRRKD